MKLTSIGIIGVAGAFGAFLRKRIEEQRFIVYGWDKKEGSDADLAKTLASDAVIFAVPPKHYVPALEEFVPRTRKDSVIVDVCTVKMVTTQALRKLADGRPYISCHPMFGPQSYLDKGGSLNGLQLVICEHTLNRAEYKWLDGFLQDGIGLTIVHMTADEHDEVQAREQLLTQYIGCVMGRTGFALNERNIHTVSAHYFYSAMKIVGNDRELFLQAAKLNPHWPKVLAQFELAEAQHRLEMLNGT